MSTKKVLTVFDPYARILRCKRQFPVRIKTHPNDNETPASVLYWRCKCNLTWKNCSALPVKANVYPSLEKWRAFSPFFTRKAMRKNTHEEDIYLGGVSESNYKIIDLDDD